MEHNILRRVKSIRLFPILGLIVMEVQGSENQGLQIVQSPADPYVMKVYPDGTKLLVRWSEVGKAVDHGEKHGGSPKIVAYDSKQVPSGPVPVEDSGSKKNMFGGVPTYVPYDPGQGYKQADAEGLTAIPSARRSAESDFGPTEGFVLGLGFGPSFQSNLSTSGVDGGVPETGEVNFAPGIRFDLVPGYNLNSYVRFELSTSFIYNQFHSLRINGETYYASNNFGFSSSGLYQIPIIPSVTFRLPVEKEITLYLGGGFGANFVYGTLLGELPDNTFLNSNLNSGSSSSWNYAWNLTTGIDWNVMPGLDLNFGYKCLSTLNPVIDAWEGGDAVQGPTQTFFNHTASLGLTWKF